MGLEDMVNQAKDMIKGTPGAAEAVEGGVDQVKEVVEEKTPDQVDAASSRPPRRSRTRSSHNPNLRSPRVERSRSGACAHRCTGAGLGPDEVRGIRPQCAMSGDDTAVPPSARVVESLP